MRRKFLLMGKRGAGKTSMRSVIFGNYVARDTETLGPTIDIERSNIRFLGEMVFNVWDCGGQEAFTESYLGTQRDNVFQDVAIVIYVFDEKRDEPKDLEYFGRCIKALSENSPDAKVFCLLHKMDLIPERNRETIVNERSAEIREVGSEMKLEILQTSIWDESLYKAWSMMVCSLVPNLRALSDSLSKFCEICSADEVVLFELGSFLVIAQATLRPHQDLHRFEKISTIIKNFKLSCSKSKAHFDSLQLQTSNLTALIQTFTDYTSIMLITSEPGVQPAASRYNLDSARTHFEGLLQDAWPGR